MRASSRTSRTIVVSQVSLPNVDGAGPLGVTSGLRDRPPRRLLHPVAEGWNEIEAAGFAVDYLEARNAKTLARAETLADGPLRLLVAARLGKTRLIDNVAV